MGEPGDGFQAEAPRDVIPFNPRANEVEETRNGFVRGRNTGIPCEAGTCFHAVPNALFEGGKGRGITARWILREKTFRKRDPAPALVLSPLVSCETCRPGMAETDTLPAPTNFPHRHLSSASDRPRRPPPGRTRLLAVEAIRMEVGLLARSSAFVPGPDRGVAAINDRASWSTSQAGHPLFRPRLGDHPRQVKPEGAAVLYPWERQIAPGGGELLHDDQAIPPRQHTL